MKFEDIKFIKNSDGVVSIVLNRPSKRNSISQNMMNELVKAIGLANSDDSCRLVKLEGSGKVFCAGGDLDWMRSQAASSRADRMNEAKKLANMFRIMDTATKPILGIIRGHAFGGGLGLISICDYSICSSEVKFGLTETRLGLIPATISPYVFAKIGSTHSRDIFLSGEIFNALKAQRIGLVNEVVDSDIFEKSVDSYVDYFKETSIKAVSASKQLIQMLRPKISDELINETAKRLADTWESDDAKRGIEGFLKSKRVEW